MSNLEEAVIHYMLLNKCYDVKKVIHHHHVEIFTHKVLRSIFTKLMREISKQENDQDKVQRLTSIYSIAENKRIEEIEAHTYNSELSGGIANLISLLNRYSLQKVVGQTLDNLQESLISKDATDSWCDIEAACQHILEKSSEALLGGEGVLDGVNMLDVNKVDLQATLNHIRASKRKTKLHVIDEFLGGISHLETYVIAGRPSAGKTALIISVLKQLTLDLMPGEKVNCFFVSADMPTEEIYIRTTCSFTGHNKHEMAAMPVDTSAMQSKLNMWVIQLFNAGQICKYANMFFSRCGKGPKYLVIDYLQLIQSNTAHTTRADEIGAIIKQLKTFCLKYPACLIMLSQLTRNSGLELSSLRSSGSIEQDSDVVIMLDNKQMFDHRITSMPNSKGIVETEQYLDKDNYEFTIEVKIAKNRNGSKGIGIMKLKGSTYQFKNIDAKL